MLKHWDVITHACRESNVEVKASIMDSQKSNSIALRIKQWMLSRIQAIINAGNGSMPDTDMCQDGLLLLTEI